MDPSIHPDSPLALSKASLARHMKILVKHSLENVLLTTKEVTLAVSICLLNLLFMALFPVTLPLFAYLNRRSYRQDVARWTKTTEQHQKDLIKNLTSGKYK